MTNKPTDAPTTMSPSKSPVKPYSQIVKLTASDGAMEDYFGMYSNSVAVSGNTAVVGAYYDDDLANASGSAYVFKYNEASNVWEQAAKLKASDGAAGDQFGQSVALSVSASTIVIGAVAGAGSKGSAYVFKYNASLNTWAQVAKLVASDGVANDRFGWSVSVSETENTIVVGAPWKANYQGAAYVFQYNSASNVWVQSQKLTALDGVGNDFFGEYHAFSDATNSILLSSRFDDDKGNDSGSAYVFQYNTASNVWAQTAKLTASDGAANDAFSWSISVSGNTAVIGAPWKVSSTGAAYVFQYNGESNIWTQVAKLTASDGAGNDGFARGVTVSGNTIVVGASNDDDKGLDSGSAYVFKYNTASNTWSQVAKLTASDGTAGDSFGRAVAISGNTAFITAPLDDDKGTDSGSVYVFDTGVVSTNVSAFEVYKLSTDSIQWLHAL